MFLKNNNYGSKTKRGKARVDADLKAKLKDITNEILDSINVEELTRTQKMTFLKSSLAYLLPKEYINETHIQEDLPLFISDDKPVVIAFNNAEQRAEYNEADDIRKAEMEKELRVDMFGNTASA
jgi:ribosome-binding ATPase YchF (GTP1/OBG family)